MEIFANIFAEIQKKFSFCFLSLSLVFSRYLTFFPMG